MLQGKVAVITGAARGIGEGVARLFAAEGAKVVLGDVQVERAQELARELGRECAVAVACDVTQEADVERLVGAAVDSFERLDVMCNNAGVVGALGVREGLLENLDMREYERTVQVNQRGVVLGTKHAARAMIAGGSGGVILNTASICAFRANVANSGAPSLVPAAYLASKAAVVALTQLAACELSPYGIRVNAVAPGTTLTPMLSGAIPGNPPLEGIEGMMAAMSPLKGQVLRPADIANGLLYLASDMGRCVNGHTLVIDLGTTVGVAGTVPALETPAQS